MTEDWEQETCDDGRRLGQEREMVRHRLEHQQEDQARVSAAAQVEE